MDRSTQIWLVNITYSADSIGQQTPTEVKTPVYASLSSISRAEWFDAGRNGMKPEYVFTIFEPDYNGQTIIEYDSKRYGVYRTYRGKNETLELYTESKAGV